MDSLIFCFAKFLKIMSIQPGLTNQSWALWIRKAILFPSNCSIFNKRLVGLGCAGQSKNHQTKAATCKTWSENIPKKTWDHLNGYSLRSFDDSVLGGFQWLGFGIRRICRSPEVLQVNCVCSKPWGMIRSTQHLAWLHCCSYWFDGYMPKLKCRKEIDSYKHLDAFGAILLGIGICDESYCCCWFVVAYWLSAGSLIHSLLSPPCLLC